LEPSQNATKLFVYGTLRRGEPAHALLGNARLVGRARTDACFTLVDAGGYPGMVAGGHTKVTGEIYEIDPAAWPELDRYEEAPEVYERVQLVVEGHVVGAYLLRARHAAGKPVIESGDWSGQPR
jgi:gamma-glutamylaminecyclotransferase